MSDKRNSSNSWQNPFKKRYSLTINDEIVYRKWHKEKLDSNISTGIAEKLLNYSKNRLKRNRE